MSKEEISQSYIETVRKERGVLIRRPLAERTGIIYGAEKKTSIGDAIRFRLVSLGFGTLICPNSAHTDIRIYDSIADDMNRSGPDDLDLLICCQGWTYLDWFENQHPAALKNMVEVNLLGSMYAAHAFVNATIRNPYKKQIIFIGSMAYNHVLNASAPYCAAKAGLAHLTKCLAWELAPKGYDVFCIHPSNVEGTPMTDDTIKGIMRYRNVDRATAEAYWGAVLPKNRWLNAKDIARVVEFIVGGTGEYLSGANLEMAGGQR